MSCGNGTKTKDDPFQFRNHYPLPVRVMVGLFGCVLWLIPYALLIAPSWNSFSWMLVPFGILGVIGAIGGSAFLFSAVMGEARETRLDLSCQQLIQTSRDWLFRRKVTRTSFTDLAILELRQPSWATDEAVFSIHPVLDNGDSLPAFGAFPSREEADKVKALMGFRPDGLEGLPQTWTTAEIEALKRSMTAQASNGSCGCGSSKQGSCGSHATPARIH